MRCAIATLLAMMAAPAVSAESAPNAFLIQFEEVGADADSPVGTMWVQVDDAAAPSTFRYWGAAAGPGVHTLWMEDGTPVAWQSQTGQAHGIERTLWGDHVVHCVFGGPCATGAIAQPSPWTSQDPWAAGHPHGAAAPGDDTRGWMPEGERGGLRWSVVRTGQVDEPLPDAPQRPAAVPRAAPTPWLFHDADPSPWLPTSLGDAWTRAADAPGWDAWWQKHPEAQAVAVEAPRNHLMEGSWPVVWTVELQADDGRWTLELSDDMTSLGTPGMLQEHTGNVVPRPPPEVAFRRVQDAVGRPPETVPTLGAAHAAWAQLSNAPEDIRFRFYERSTAGTITIGGEVASMELGAGSGRTYLIMTDDGAIRGFAGPAATSGEPTVNGASVADSWAPGAPTQVAFGAALLIALRWMGLALFSRKVPEVESPFRQRMLDAVRATPGMTLSELARHLGVHHARIQYHSAVLTRTQRLTVQRVGRRTRLFAGVDIPPAPPAFARVIATLEEHGPATASELARHVGVSRSMVSRWLRQAGAAGMAAGDEGRPRRWHATRPPP